ncbi:imelysin family protein, partial [Pseudomonadota bacterium]
FHQTMDAWAGVQHLRTGPVESFDRYHRFQLWPDKHNTGNKQIAKLLAAEDIDALTTEHFGEASVAIQGLSAMERLLFGKKGTVEQFIKENKASYHCLLVAAIAHNLTSMSRSLVEEWSKEPPYEMLFISAGGMTYELKLEKDISSRKEITTGFFNNLYTQVQSVIDQKLLRPLGKKSKAKPRYLESWRSLRSLRNIELNLRAVESLYETGFAPALNNKELHKQIKKAFKTAYNAASTIKSPLYDALKDNDKRKNIEALLASTRKLQSLLTGPLPEALDIELGFNALDGD